MPRTAGIARRPADATGGAANTTAFPERRGAGPGSGGGLFVERETYRRRRLADAARLVPVLGLMLWALPLLWANSGDGMRATHALIFLFGVWGLLVALTALILARMRRADRMRRLASDERAPSAEATAEDRS